MRRRKTPYHCGSILTDRSSWRFLQTTVAITTTEQHDPQRGPTCITKSWNTLPLVVALCLLLMFVAVMVIGIKAAPLVAR